ncbi:MAG: penicillin-binding protein 2 [Leptospiraceae bacterium]|nr:penicillin-binding protein 2 [Leptospiraceae bacterium]
MVSPSVSQTEFKLEKNFRNRLYFFTGLIVLSQIIFILQLINLQIINGVENSLKAERFVRKSESLPAARGQVYDRNFISPEFSKRSILVSNSPTLDVILNYSQFGKNPEKIKQFIVTFYKTLSIPKGYYAKLLNDSKFTNKVRRKKPIVLLQGISREQHERISVFDNIYKNVTLITTPRRIYHMGPALAHVTGYVGKPSSKDLKNRDIKSYQLIGKGGIEIQYDEYLRGVDGFRIQKRNSEGHIEEEKVIEHAKMGKNLVLTIDKNIQLSAYKALKGFRGTIIALKPGTGEVLAMASNPSFDPNILSGKNRKERTLHLKRIQKNRSFYNLAIQSKNPPASLFKTMVALAALENTQKVPFDSSYTYKCTGKYTLKSHFPGVADQDYLCWKPAGHGSVNLIEAIEKSCSVYFYNLGYRLGPEAILSYAKLFRLDKTSKIDIPGERVGFVPSNEWKKRKYGVKWFDGDTINLSIGQGFIATTPIGMSLFYMAILNNGKIYQPFLLSEVRNPVNNSIIYKNESKIIQDIPIKPSTIETLKHALKSVTRTGTAAYVMNGPGIPDVAGKTGTAQTRRRGLSSSNHAWFVGYAPADAPVEEQILVTVFVEYGVGGSVGAAPLAKQVFEAAFRGSAIKKAKLDGFSKDKKVTMEALNW